MVRSFNHSALSRNTKTALISYLLTVLFKYNRIYKYMYIFRLSLYYNYTL